MDSSRNIGSRSSSSNSSGSSRSAGDIRDSGLRSFPSQVWSSFVDAFVETLQANGPMGAPSVGAVAAKATPPPTRLPAVKRLVAVGDLHGDFAKTLTAFRMAGLIDTEGRWSGGTTSVVQVGDQLDRGGEEIPILYFLERMKQEASRSGGAVHVLNGNHETMNVMGNFRYADPTAKHDFRRWYLLQQLGANLKKRCGVEPGLREVPRLSQCPEGLNPDLCARYLALRPRGPLTQRFLAPNPTVLQVGGNVFVHGGVLPHHVQYGLERINAETTEWMLGERRAEVGEDPRSVIPEFLLGARAVVWARDYSNKPERCKCDVLTEALDAIPGGDRMIMGHTIQSPGINSSCDGRAMRIDVGMSAGCADAQPEVLEILDDDKVYRLVQQGDRVVRVPVEEAVPKRKATDVPPSRVAA